LEMKVFMAHTEHKAGDDGRAQTAHRVLAASFGGDQPPTPAQERDLQGDEPKQAENPTLDQERVEVVVKTDRSPIEGHGIVDRLARADSDGQAGRGPAPARAPDRQAFV